MELEVTPPVDEKLERALREGLRAARASTQPKEPAWQRAALAEGVERRGYAFSPRSTRGATRA